MEKGRGDRVTGKQVIPGVRGAQVELAHLYDTEAFRYGKRFLWFVSGALGHEILWVRKLHSLLQC